MVERNLTLSDAFGTMQFYSNPGVGLKSGDRPEVPLQEAGYE